MNALEVVMLVLGIIIYTYVAYIAFYFWRHYVHRKYNHEDFYLYSGDAPGCTGQKGTNRGEDSCYFAASILGPFWIVSWILWPLFMLIIKGISLLRSLRTRSEQAGENLANAQFRLFKDKV